MISKELAPGIHVYSNVIAGHESLVNDIEDSVNLQALSWGKAYVAATDGPAVDTNTRDTETIGIPYDENIQIDFSNPASTATTTLSRMFFDAFDPIENDYKLQHSLSTEWHDVYAILKYGVGQKFINHIDDHKDYHRRMSIIYYINDDYEGGEINFPRFGISYKPNANEMLIFPSNYVYNHSVSEVTSGTRYAVVSWLR